MTFDELEKALGAANQACAGKEPDDPAHDRRQEIEELIAQTTATTLDAVVVKLELAVRLLDPEELAGRLVSTALAEIKRLQLVKS